MFASAATPMIQAASFLFKESEETWNFRKVPRPVDVEGGPFRVPYIGDEIWGSSPHTQISKKECQAK